MTEDDDFLDPKISPLARKSEREQLQADMEAFLKAGGKITAVDGYKPKESVIGEKLAEYAKRGAQKNALGMNHTRARIYNLICAGVENIADIAGAMKTSCANVSTNIKFLKKQGMIYSVRRGKWRKVEDEI